MRRSSPARAGTVVSCPRASPLQNMDWSVASDWTHPEHPLSSVCEGGLILDPRPLCEGKEREWGEEELAELSSFFIIYLKVHLSRKPWWSTPPPQTPKSGIPSYLVWPLTLTFMIMLCPPTNSIHVGLQHISIEYCLDTMSPGGKKMIKTPLQPSTNTGTNKVVIIFKWWSHHWGQWDMEERPPNSVEVGVQGKLLRGDCIWHESFWIPSGQRTWQRGTQQEGTPEEWQVQRSWSTQHR